MESVSAGEPAVANDHTSSSYTDLSTVNSPEIPASVKFAGKEISLDPIDMWERLDRELTAMSYTHGNTLLAIKSQQIFPCYCPNP